MIHKFAILSSLVLSATCMVLHHPAPAVYDYQYNDNPNYNFAYQVNDQHSGDVKSQHESRRGDTVLGQYSLLQPDGIQRTVDYRADDHTGFQATVNNNGRHPSQHGQANFEDVARQQNVAVQNYQAYSTPTVAHAAPVHTPVAISRSSFTQTISHGPVQVQSHGPVQYPWP